MTITAQSKLAREEAVRETQAADSAQESFAPVIQDDKIRGLVKRFKLLSDETRLRILFYLANTDELHVRALCDLLSQSQPAVSHHLAMLRTAGVVEPRREGKHNFYRLLPGGFEQLLRVVFADDALSDTSTNDIAAGDGHTANESWTPTRPK